jgi:peptide/nickel transport system ATP-binding protein
MSQPLLQIRNATKIYKQRSISGESRPVIALQDFNLTLPASPASIVAIAGESGSGKTTLAQLVLGFIRPSSGQIIFDGQDMTTATPGQIKEYRRQVQAVFQDPFGVFNPFYRVRHVFDLVINNFRLTTSKAQSRDRIEEALNVVGLHGEDVLRKYPHQLSGGQRQRIMMARAYMVKPRLIVADEPVSMVDASLRASILDTMMRLKNDDGISFLYITHDLSTAYQIGDQIYVLYQGTVAEQGRAIDVIDQPRHPYVQLLVASVPVPDPDVKWQGEIVLPPEEEMRSSVHSGCRFYPRCPKRMDICLTAHPPLYKIDELDHQASCYLYSDRPITNETDQHKTAV